MPHLAALSGEIEAVHMLKRLFKPKAAYAAGQALYAATVAQARSPALYLDLRVPDTPEGRFELYSLHVYLVLARLKAQGAAAAETSQVLFDTYLSGLDHGLRELGVGDLSVGKRMRKLGEAFYGRIRSYETALGQLPDRSALEALVARTVYAGAPDARTGLMADYLLRQRAALADQPVASLCEGRIEWSSL